MLGWTERVWPRQRRGPESRFLPGESSDLRDVGSHCPSPLGGAAPYRHPLASASAARSRPREASRRSSGRVPSRASATWCAPRPSVITSPLARASNSALKPDHLPPGTPPRTTSSLARGMVALCSMEVPSCPVPRSDAVGNAVSSARPCSTPTPDWGRASGPALPRPASGSGMPRTAGPGATAIAPSPARTIRTTSSPHAPPRGRPRCRRTISRLSSAVSAPRCETR